VPGGQAGHLGTPGLHRTRQPWKSQAPLCPRSFATNPAPTLGSWCGSGGCAEFFGGQSAGDAHAVAWQWSQEGGDFDITYWGPLTGP